MSDMFTLAIGDDQVIYHIRQTRAPRDYDGFGTIQLATWSGEDKRHEERLVLIRDEHLSWQTARYSSGSFASAVPEYYDVSAIKEEIWKRITGKEDR